MNYYCCNYYGDFNDLYSKEYIPSRDDGIEFLFGMPVFNYPNWHSDTVKFIQDLIPYKCELHGIALDHINLGIWADEKPKGFKVLK